jgi:hypothetical protein
MSLLGKILAILNVLAALGFVYLAAADWGKRHAWAYSVFRHELIIDGLPVDESETSADDKAPIVDRISDKSAEDIFRQAGGQPVKTQRAAVKQLHDQVRAKIQGATDEAAQRQALYDTLLPLTRNFRERELLEERILGKEKAPIDQLLSDFDALFQTDKLGTGGFAFVMPKYERQAIAHLFLGLTPDVGAHNRIQVVVGLKEFSDELSRQADALQRMSQEVRLAMARDRTTFEGRYEALVQDIRHRAQVLAERQFDLRNQNNLRDEHKALVAARNKEIAEVQQKMEDARANLLKILDAQATEEDAIHRTNRLFRDTLRKNQELERQIRALEKVGTEDKQ